MSKAKNLVKQKRDQLLVCHTFRILGFSKNIWQKIGESTVQEFVHTILNRVSLNSYRFTQNEQYRDKNDFVH